MAKSEIKIVTIPELPSNLRQEVREWASYTTPAIGIYQLVLIPGKNISRMPFMNEKMRSPSIYLDADFLVKSGQKIWRTVNSAPPSERINLQQIFQVFKGKKDRSS